MFSTPLESTLHEECACVNSEMHSFCKANSNHVRKSIELDSCWVVKFLISMPLKSTDLLPWSWDLYFPPIDRSFGCHALFSSHVSEWYSFLRRHIVSPYLGIQICYKKAYLEFHSFFRWCFFLNWPGEANMITPDQVKLPWTKKGTASPLQNLTTPQWIASNDLLCEIWFPSV